MRTLIRNCLHGSSIAIWMEYGHTTARPVSILKTSSQKDGMEDLEREFNGFSWYNARAGNPVPGTISRRSEFFASVSYPYLDGQKYCYSKGYAKNIRAIEGVIEHYALIWKDGEKGKLSAMHGDLSLDNVIFQSTGPVIIDWEHFRPSAAPLGFDALYFILECTWFEKQSSGRLGQETLDHMKASLSYLHEHECIAPDFFERPMQSVLSFISNNGPLWGAQLARFPGKLPVTHFRVDELLELDGRLLS